MIECICINDKNRPNEIPIDKWVKEGEKYHVIYTWFAHNQKELAFDLYEIQLTEKEYPYEHFLAKRFGFTQDQLLKLIEMIEECSKFTMPMEELLKQTELTET